MTTEEIYERLRRYFDKEMSREEEISFEAALENDPELAEMADIYRTAMEAETLMGDADLYEDLRKHLRENPIDPPKQGLPSVRRPLVWAMSFMVAAIALVLLIGYGPVENEAVVAQHAISPWNPARGNLDIPAGIDSSWHSAVPLGSHRFDPDFAYDSAMTATYLAYQSDRPLRALAGLGYMLRYWPRFPAGDAAAMNDFPSHGELEIFRANVLARTGDLATAEKILLAIGQSDFERESGRAKFDLAILYLQQGRREDALAQLEGIPENSELGGQASDLRSRLKCRFFCR